MQHTQQHYIKSTEIKVFVTLKFQTTLFVCLLRPSLTKVQPAALLYSPTINFRNLRGRDATLRSTSLGALSSLAFIDEQGRCQGGSRRLDGRAREDSSSRKYLSVCKCASLSGVSRLCQDDIRVCASRGREEFSVAGWTGEKCD